MNMRRLSYGLLLALASTLVVACGGDEPKVDAPANPTSAPTDAPPPTATADATPPPAPTQTADPTPPPPPAKPAKDKWVGKFVQDFSGDVKDAADAAAKKSAGKNDKDNKKYNAAMDKAKAAVADNTLDNTADGFTWSVKGKAAHTVKVEVANGTDTTLSLKLKADGKKDLKGAGLDVSFSDDDTFSFVDPFAKDPKKAQKLVFKRSK